MDDKIEVSESAVVNLANSVLALNDGIKQFMEVYTLKEAVLNQRIADLENRIAKIEKWLLEVTVDMTVVN